MAAERFEDEGAGGWALSDSVTGHILVIARWEPAPGQHTAVEALLPWLVRSSLAEPGCLGYEVLREGDGGVIVLLERYRDPQALEDHRSSQHFQDTVIARILPLLAAREVTTALVA